jgi:flagella basal body P-ring formation protein FlgA
MTDLTPIFTGETIFTAETGSLALTRRILLVLALLVTPPVLLLLAGSAWAASPTLVAPARADAPVLRIVVPVRDLNRGEVIGESDLTFTEVTGTALAPSTVTRFETLTGMQTRRLLRANQAVRAEDVRRPVVVTKGQTVTMTFQAPGIELSAMGRAMSEGGVGDTVTVQNPMSFRMVSATVTGAGTVRAEMASAPLNTARR